MTTVTSSHLKSFTEFDGTVFPSNLRLSALSKRVNNNQWWVQGFMTREKYQVDSTDTVTVQLSITQDVSYAVFFSPDDGATLYIVNNTKYSGTKPLTIFVTLTASGKSDSTFTLPSNKYNIGYLLFSSTGNGGDTSIRSDRVELSMQRSGTVTGTATITSLKINQ